MKALILDSLEIEGIYVIGFSYSVVPQDEARRIGIQVSAGHEIPDLDHRAVAAFKKMGSKLRLI